MATPLRVLILEDRASDAELNLRELRRAGFDPDWERVETEADYVAHLDPSLDLILADYALPQFDGLLALQLLQGRGLDIPFIIVSGTIGEELAVNAMKRGATDYLLKDRLARLGPAVTQALEQHRLRRERKQVEERLRVQATALEAAANATVMTDRTGSIFWVNPAFTQLTGYTRDEVLGRNLRQLKSGKHDQAFYRHLWETILSGQVWRGEMINKRKDESLYTEAQTITPVRGEHGEISHFIAIKQDITERKRAEEALRDANDTLEAVIQASPMGISILESDGNVKLWNPAAERIFGWRKEEVLGRPLPSIPPDKSAEHRAFLERALRGDAFSDIQVVRQTKDGSLIDISLTTAPLRDAKGDVWGAMGIMTDITERKLAEKAQARLVAILEATPDFIGIADTHGNVLYLNAGGRKMMGAGEDEDVSALMIADSHPEWAGKLVLGEGIPAAIRDGVWSGETALLSRDGREIAVSQVILAHMAPDGTAEFLSTIARDISERKRAEEARQALYQASLEIQEPLGLQDRLERIIRTAQTLLELDRVNLFLADPEGRWLEAVASIGTDERLEKIRVPIGPEGGALAHAFLNQEAIVWEGKDPVPERWRLKSPYARIPALRSVGFIILPLVVQGRAIGVIAVDRKFSRLPLESETLEVLQPFAAQAALTIEHGRLFEAQQMAAIRLEAKVEDRTRDLREAMLLLEVASQHKSAFLANMSHELRTPLSSIIGFSDLLRDQKVGPLTEQQTRYVHNIRESGRHLLALINDLLDVSKVEAGKLELRPEPFDLREAIGTALSEVRPQCLAKALQVALQVDEPLSRLTADPIRFRQVLLNLLSNAIKFTHKGGSITVTAKRVRSAECEVRRETDSTSHLAPRTSDVDEVVEIAVADTGIGIKPEDLPRLFQPFTQLEGIFTKQHYGTGLGLALTKRLVELHGGTVRADSEGEGRGSTFTVRLPLAPRV